MSTAVATADFARAIDAEHTAARGRARFGAPKLMHHARRTALLAVLLAEQLTELAAALTRPMTLRPRRCGCPARGLRHRRGADCRPRCLSGRDGKGKRERAILTRSYQPALTPQSVTLGEAATP